MRRDPHGGYVVCAMPKRGVLSSRLESLQGQFGGREGGVPENVEGKAVPKAKQFRFGKYMQGRKRKGIDA